MSALIHGRPGGGAQRETDLYVTSPPMSGPPGPLAPDAGEPLAGGPPASDALPQQADGVTGQILSARNNEIYLFNQTRPIRTLQRSDGWTPDKLDKQLKGAFAASFTPLDRSSDVFSWDPV